MPFNSGEKDPEMSAPSHGSEVQPHPPAQGINAVAVLWTFGKCLGALLPVYLAGYYRVSTSLLVCGMMVYTGWKHAREAKEERLRSAMQLLGDEQEFGSLKMSKIKRDLPAWVNFPDVEKVEWLNKVLQQVWPFVGQYLEKLLVETIAPSIRASSNHLQTLSFTKVDMGDKAMKVVGIKAHTENDKRQVLLDLYISYVGNVEINVEVKRYFCKAGVKGIQLNGMMRVILEPLIGDVPIVGAVTMFFIRRPKLDINWTGLTNLLDIPGLNVMSDSMIMDAIASFLVLPNRLVVPLVPNLHLAHLRSPLPRGVVRIHLVEAQNLAAKDSYVKGVMAGLSDPYAILRVGPQMNMEGLRLHCNVHSPSFHSGHMGMTFNVIVHEVPGQELEVEVYDKDPDQDDFLGRYMTKLDLGIVKKSIAVDNWFPLKDTPSGRVHLKLEWLALMPTTDRLEQILKRNESVTSKTADPPSSAILVVYLDKAEALPMKKGNKEPNPMVQLSVQDITRESKTCYTTVDPEWEEAFTFFIQDPRKQDIDIQVKDVDRVQTLGSLTIPLSRVLSTSGLSLDQWFQLDNSGSASRIYINAVLRMLWLDEEHITSDVSSHLESGGKQLPQETSPHSSFATEGLLRIHLLAGQNLVPKDNMMGGMVKGKSDPYVKINIGGETFTSEVIKANLNPTWNEMYEVILTQLPGQELILEVLDKDMDMKDDFMGRLKINLKDIIDSQYTDQWYSLNDVKSGRVHLVLEWVPTVSEADQVDQVLQFYSRQSYQNKAVPSAGLLFVFIEQADGLPVKKSGKEPKVGAQIVLGEMSRKTTVCDRSISPEWNEAFCFLVRDPREDILLVKLSHSWTLPMGSLVVPIKELLAEPELVLDQWFHLDGASPESQILLRAELKVGEILSKQNPFPIMCLFRSSSVDPPVETLVPQVMMRDEVDVKTPVADVTKDTNEEASSPAAVKPPHTSPDVSFANEGLMRIILMEAQDLVPKDNLMGGLKKGKSDPYAKIAIGETTFKSNVVKENLNPVWNEMYQVLSMRQDVRVELYDKDMDKDDFLGRFNVSMADIIRSQYTDQWYALSDVKCGRVRLILEWVQTVSHNGTLDKVRTSCCAHAQFVFLCVQFKKSGKEPKAGAELVFGNTTYKTKVCDRTRSPEWNEAFYFLVRDPTEEMLVIKLSSAWDQPMGSLVVPVKELLSEPQLVLDEWLPLDGALPESEILLRAELKVGEDHHFSIILVSVPCAKYPEAAEDETESFTIQPPDATVSLTEHIIAQDGFVSPSHVTLAHQLVDDQADGLLRIHLLEAQSLVAKDNLMGGMVKGKSDPYVKINVGGVTFKSHVVKENLNPTWNEMYEVNVDQLSFDKDFDSDDFLGRFVSIVLWYTLKDVKSGRLHLILEWVPTVSRSAQLHQVLQLQSLQSFKNKAIPSAALLFVHLERAHSLPLKKSGKEPKAGAELVLGDTTYKTQLCDRSTNPQWGESFYFLVHDPQHQMLVLKFSSGWDQPMGSLVVCVRELLAQPQLVLDQWFHLDGAAPDSQVLLRLELKVGMKTVQAHAYSTATHTVVY
uniref:Extended synaptotagmin-1-like n=1 Tax=Hippocampus comes TaxID=109280 RepID=A0A3Q3EBH0_HIPCM